MCICVSKMLRCAILSALLLVCHGKAQSSDDTDEMTLTWIKDSFSQDYKNNDEIKHTSFSKPGETFNKFDDEGDSLMSVEQPCKTEEGVTGVCVPYYLCNPSTRKVIGDGTQLIDIRAGDSCPHYLELCCQLEGRITLQEEDVTPKLVLTPDSSNLNTNRPYKVSTAGAIKECGWNDPDQFVFQPPSQAVADRAIYANYGEFPWMVALMRKSDTTVWVQNDYIGGGSLIHPSVVMTAYHKLFDVEAHNLKCRAGEWDTQTEKEQYKIQERDAERYVVHPDFFRTSLYNDIALIFLKSPFDLANAPHIGIACLARFLPNEETNSCFSMGWGKPRQNDTYVNILKKVKLPLVEQKMCETMLHTNTRFRKIPVFKLHESLTCAGGEENVDTWVWDGGSSLVCPIENRKNMTRYAVVGMAAYDLGCGKKDVPGVYVNVTHLFSWVENEVAGAGYNISTFSF